MKKVGVDSIEVQGSSNWFFIPDDYFVLPLIHNRDITQQLVHAQARSFLVSLKYFSFFCILVKHLTLPSFFGG